MNRRRIAIVMISILLPGFAHAANPFLDAPSDKPVSAKFRGAEWGDEIQQDEIPLTARVVTTRVAKMPWGAIFKIEFTDLKSSAPQKREIRPDYKKISALNQPPEFGQGEIYGIARGSSNYQDGLWKTTINLKGDLCVYDSSHPSGHFKKIVWKKGVGLVEYASGYGARKDGFRFKREK
jgi:hypothetical protein